MNLIGERESAPIEAPWASLRLPPFPRIALRVLQLTNDENLQLHQLSELISSDAVLASEVLRIANSAVYALSTPACSIQQAIAILGANHLQGLCLTVAARAYLGRALDNPAIRAVWQHNLACAVIAEQLAGAGFMDRDRAYTAGLLHDIGRIALAAMQPLEYASLMTSQIGTGASILEAEKDLFGCDHCEAGRHMVSGWRLPCDFAAVVGTHHVSRKSDRSWSLEELIKVACRLADTAGFSAFAGCETVAFDELLEELPPRERRNFHSELETLVAELMSRMKVVECG